MICLETSVSIDSDAFTQKTLSPEIDEGLSRWTAGFGNIGAIRPKGAQRGGSRWNETGPATVTEYKSWPIIRLSVQNYPEMRRRKEDEKERVTKKKTENVKISTGVRSDKKWNNNKNKSTGWRRGAPGECRVGWRLLIGWQVDIKGVL